MGSKKKLAFIYERYIEILSQIESWVIRIFFAEVSHKGSNHFKENSTRK